MSFLEDGFAVIPFQSNAALRSLLDGRRRLEAIFGPLESCLEASLEQRSKGGDAIADIPRSIIEAELPTFQALIGADIRIQKQPFLRISRPGVAADNIGFHRDTWYGDSPYELAVWIPFTDTDEDNALRVAPGSHLWSEAEHPVETFASDAVRGSEKHKLGFLYAPKRLVTPAETVPIPVRLGELIVFNLAILHGQELNRSSRTRFSTDIRLANALAPVRWVRSRGEDYYEDLCVSPVTEHARLYAGAQS